MAKKLFVVLPIACASLAQPLPPVTSVGYGAFLPELRVAPGQLAQLALPGVRFFPGENPGNYNQQTLVAPPGSSLPLTLGESQFCCPLLAQVSPFSLQFRFSASNRRQRYVAQYHLFRITAFRASSPFTCRSTCLPSPVRGIRLRLRRH